MDHAAYKEDYSRSSYTVDVWDAIQIIVRLPRPKGATPYSISFRKTMGDIYEWLESFTLKDGAPLCDRVIPCPKASLLETVKAFSLQHLHQLYSTHDLESQEREQGAVDAYSLFYDRARGEL